MCYDVEEADPGLAHAFAESFRVCKANGFKVLVTVSHSAPYGVQDKVELMASFFASSDIDYLSPQLYTTGQECNNDYSANGCPWSEYTKSKPLLVPSVVRSSLFGDAKAYFKKQGVHLSGFVQWAQQ